MVFITHVGRMCTPASCTCSQAGYVSAALQRTLGQIKVSWSIGNLSVPRATLWFDGIVIWSDLTCFSLAHSALLGTDRLFLKLPSTWRPWLPPLTRSPNHVLSTSALYFIVWLPLHSICSLVQSAWGLCVCPHVGDVWMHLLYMSVFYVLYLLSCCVFSLDWGSPLHENTSACVLECPR